MQRTWSFSVSKLPHVSRAAAVALSIRTESLGACWGQGGGALSLKPQELLVGEGSEGEGLFFTKTGPVRFLHCCGSGLAHSLLCMGAQQRLWKEVEKMREGTCRDRERVKCNGL